MKLLNRPFVHIACFGLAISLMAGTPIVMATTPYPFVESIEIASGDQEASLFVMPDGSGPHLDEAQLVDGSFINATITVHLIDLNFNPIANFPKEDVWLETENEGQAFCIGGSCPENDSDQNGAMAFNIAPRGGGWHEGPTHVYVLGNPAYDPIDYPWYWAHQPVPLRINSADISGDNVVDLVDVALFAQVLFGEYEYKADFYWDGVINLSDVGRMVQGLGVSCP